LGLFESKLLLALVYATAFSDVCSMMFVVAPYLEWHTGMFASLSINILTSVTSTPTEFIEIEKKTAWRAILLLPIELVEVETVEIQVLVNHFYSSLPGNRRYSRKLRKTNCRVVYSLHVWTQLFLSIPTTGKKISSIMLIYEHSPKNLFPLITASRLDDN